MNITALYVRTARQCPESNLIHAEILGDYAELKNYGNIKEYVDDGFSGSNMNRPEFNRLNEDIENGLVDTVIIRDSSRISRNTIELIRWLKKCNHSGVKVLSLNGDVPIPPEIERMFLQKSQVL